MLGNVKHSSHPKGDAILKGIQNAVMFPKKVQNLNILRKRQCLVAPRFGGRTIYLWVKGKTRVWVDRKNVYTMNTHVPKYTSEGTLASAELYKNDCGNWVLAFEDMIMYKGDLGFAKKPFPERQATLCTFVRDLLQSANAKIDPGVFCVKPWYTPKVYGEKYRSIEWTKTPEWVLIWANGFWFCKIQDTTSQNVYTIQRASDTNPDQYDLLDTNGIIVHKACVRTLRASVWLRSLKDGTRVKCRNIQGIENPEPYECV
jgi:hypothetical protein